MDTFGHRRRASPLRQRQGVVPESVRAQLLALGIPPKKHSLDDLAGYFPCEFNIASAGLDAENMAKVLVHLATQGIIAVPSAGKASFLKKVEPGWHFCQFYRDFQQYLELLGPYIAEGLRNGEACLWVIPPQVTVETACGAIRDRLEDVDRYLAAGQLEVLDHKGWYFDQFGRFKTFEEIAGALIGRQDQALARGFKFVRAAGDAGWVSGTAQSKNFIDYEMKVNAAIGQTKIAAICTFHAALTADELVSVVVAHQDALEQRRA